MGARTPIVTFQSSVSQPVGYGPLVGHGRIFNGPRPDIIEIE